MKTMFKLLGYSRLRESTVVVAVDQRCSTLALRSACWNVLENSSSEKRAEDSIALHRIPLLSLSIDRDWCKASAYSLEVVAR